MFTLGDLNGSGRSGGELPLKPLSSPWYPGLYVGLYIYIYIYIYI